MHITSHNPQTYILRAWFISQIIASIYIKHDPSLQTQRGTWLVSKCHWLPGMISELRMWCHTKNRKQLNYWITCDSCYSQLWKTCVYDDANRAIIFFWLFQGMLKTIKNKAKQFYVYLKFNTTLNNEQLSKQKQI